MTTPSTPTGGGATPTTAGTAGTAGGTTGSTTTSTGDAAAGPTNAPAPEPTPEEEAVKVQIEEAETPAGKIVSYIGHCKRKTITSADWERLGITLDTVQWNALNGWKVDGSDWPDEALKYAEHMDKNLTVTEE